MKYTWDRIDYTTEEFCQGGCGKPLTRGIAYIVIDNSGKEYHCGRKCAENRAIKELPKDIPNITLSESSGSSRDSSDNIEGDSANEHSIKKEALEYLLLRHHFNNCPKIRHENIEDWYKRKSSLTDDDFLHIIRTKKKLQNNKILSSLFLKRIFKIEHELRKKGKVNPKSVNFMDGMIEKIHKFMSLTEGEKNGISKWFNNDIDLSFLPTKNFKKP